MAILAVALWIGYLVAYQNYLDESLKNRAQATQERNDRDFKRMQAGTYEAPVKVHVVKDE